MSWILKITVWWLRWKIPSEILIWGQLSGALMRLACGRFMWLGAGSGISVVPWWRISIFTFTYLATTEEFVEKMRNEGREIIAIDNIEGSVNMSQTSLPKARGFGIWARRAGDFCGISERCGSDCGDWAIRLNSLYKRRCGSDCSDVLLAAAKCAGGK